MLINNFLKRPSAVAEIRGSGDAPRLGGKVEFFDTPVGVLVNADIVGLPDNNPLGFFGFHIHMGGKCDGDNFSETGQHFDTDSFPHPEHAGDLPPLLYCSGNAYLSVLTDRFEIKDIIGKTVVIHGSPDDFTTQPSGNAGTKIACGVIRSIYEWRKKQYALN